LAFVGIGALAGWPDYPVKSIVLFSIGAAFIVAGLVIPTMLGPVERAWMALAHLISKVTTPIFMGIVYFLLVTPIGYIRNARGKGPFGRERGTSSWQHHDAATARREQMERQF